MIVPPGLLITCTAKNLSEVKCQTNTWIHFMSTFNALISCKAGSLTQGPSSYVTTSHTAFAEVPLSQPFRTSVLNTVHSWLISTLLLLSALQL